MAKLLSVVVLVTAVWALPAGAAAEEIVPPGNSAASQYTEAFPTAAGEKETEGSGSKGRAVPAQTLGARNAHRLESKGAEGKAVAEFAAETSPTPVVTSSDESTDTDAGGGSGDSGRPAPAAGGGAGGNGGNGAEESGGKEAEGAPAVGHGGSGGSGGVSRPAGSSGLGEVLGQATGSSSSGTLGLLLPLIVIGAVVWALLFLWRQKQRVA